MRQLIFILIGFALPPAGWAHSTYPSGGGTMFISYQYEPLGNRLIKVTHFAGEACTVTATATEVPSSGHGRLLGILNVDTQPALDVNLYLTGSRPPSGDVLGTPPDVWTEEVTSVNLSWKATGATADGSTDPNCTGSGNVIFNVVVQDHKPQFHPFKIPDRGGISSITSGTGSSITTGYGRIRPDSGKTTPSGTAIFGFTQGNVLVSEAAVPATPPVQSARIYAEIGNTVDTGVAIANPNPQAAAINFYFTDSGGANLGSGSTTIPAGGQIAKFLDQSPFAFSGAFQGTFTVNSPVPISIVALRGLTNERNEFLITTLPVTDLNGSPSTGNPVFPHFADGGGWMTQVVLVNPTDFTMTGTIQFRDPSGNNAIVNVNGQAGSSFPYSIPGRSSQKFQTSGAGTSTTVGSVRIVPPTGFRAPTGVDVFSFRNGGVTVAQAGVAALPVASAFRLYAEASGNFSGGEIGSIQTGFAIANPSANPATVTLELTTFDGLPAGMSQPVTITIPGNGQSAMFLNQAGLLNFAMPFQGLLRISGAGVSVVGLRGRYNERGDFLITATQPVNETAASTTAEADFPHLADGGGYTTQIILFSGASGQSSSGVVDFFDPSGQPLSLLK